MSVVGGFFGGFAICNLGEVFANSQTLNLIVTLRHLFEGDLSSLIVRLTGAIVYFLGLAFAVIFAKRTRINREILSPIISAVCLILVAAIPYTVNPLIHIYPIFFATAFQWVCFDKIEGYSSATIFSTNNYRQFTTALVEYALDGERKMLTKAKVFGFTLLWFHVGAALACAGELCLGKASVLLGLLPIIAALSHPLFTKISHSYN